MNDGDDSKVVDLGVERVRHRVPDLHVPCPRCGKSNFMRDSRCQHCGLWFQGEAFQFAPSEALPSRRRRLLLLAFWAGVALLVILLAAAIVAYVRGGSV